MELDLKESADSVVSWRIFSRDAMLILWIQSAKLESLFQNLANNKTVHPLGRDAAAICASNPTYNWMLNTQNWAVKQFGPPSDQWGWGGLTKPVTTCGFNVSFLSLVGLSAGIEIPIEYPMSRSMLREFGRAITECCRDYMLEYGKFATTSARGGVLDAR